MCSSQQSKAYEENHVKSHCTERINLSKLDSLTYRPTRSGQPADLKRSHMVTVCGWRPGAYSQIAEKST